MRVHGEADLKVLVAWMYYDEGLTHEKIARRLSLSRVAVTRLLQKARREGIVQIQITRPLPVQFQLERELEAAFGLKRAIVVPTYPEHGATLDALGRAGARFLGSLLFPGCRVGVAWSETVRRIIPYLQRPRQPLQGTVNELAGTSARQANPFSVSVQLAGALGMPLEALPVPVVVQSPAARAAILGEESIRTAMEHARQVDVAVVGLGDVGPECTLVRAGHLRAADVTVLRERGAVGDVLMRFYDSRGRHVPGPLEERVISLEWQEILRLPHVVAMAAGPRKVAPVLGALRGRLCHSLVTDVDTARRVLALAGRPAADTERGESACGPAEAD